MREKSLARNSLFNVLYKSLNVFFPLIYSAYIARVLLPSGVGKVSYAQNIVQYFTIVAALGLPNYGTREIAKVRNNSKDTNKVFNELIVINALSTTICLIAYYLLITTSPYFNEERMLFGIVGLNIIFNYINVDWFYQGKEEYSYIAIRSFIIKVFSLLAIFVLVKDVEDYKIYAFIYVFSLAGNYFFNILKLRKYKVKVTLKSIELKRHIRPVLYLLATAIAIELYTLLDTTMLGIMCDSNVVGYYTNTMKLVKVFITLITAIGGVLLPRLSFYDKQQEIDKCQNIVNRIFSIMFFLFVPCGIGLYLVADYVIPIMYGSSFTPAIETLKIATWLIYALGFSNLFGIQVLLTFGNEKKLLLCTVVGAVSNIIMNYFMIPVFYQNGAAVASVISESLVTVLTFVFANKFIRIRLEAGVLVKTMISTILMSISVIIIKSLVNDTFIALIGCIGIGAIVYMLSNLVLKNKVLLHLKENLKC